MLLSIKKNHKDVDARWTKKGGDKFFGYKNHTKVDTKSKLIDGYVVTDASVHDSQPLDLWSKQCRDYICIPLALKEQEESLDLSI